MFRKLEIKFKNLCYKTQICEKCGKDLSSEPEHGFEQLEQCGMGRYKICPACNTIFYV